jgi:hypothetical protein
VGKTLGAKIMFKPKNPENWFEWWRLVRRTMAYLAYYPGITWREAMIFALEETAINEAKQV